MHAWMDWMPPGHDDGYDDGYDDDVCCLKNFFLPDRGDDDTKVRSHAGRCECMDCCVEETNDLQKSIPTTATRSGG